MNSNENGFNHRSIQINDISLHTVIAGEKSSEPLILLHGFPDFWYGWKKVMEGLQDSYRLIAPDLKGFNLSDKPLEVEDYRLEILVDDIKHLSEQLGLNKFNLAGHDWGGMIAWAFAEKYPELLKKLVIINAPHYKIFSKKIKKSKTQRRASGYISQLMKPNSDEILERQNFQMLRFAVFQNARNPQAFSEDDKTRYIEAWSQPNTLKASPNYYRANRSYDEWTGLINVPTLVIFGMKDTYIKPLVLENLSDYVSDLKIVKSENSSHWVMNDDPELVIKSIDSFLKGTLS
ncbi:MAG: alpha/beta hydrolase [Promethearchaeota archaeon]|nr:MAG: alpha/beta hydrolase [Candidatus Lokiarchaeota archaeon]